MAPETAEVAALEKDRGADTGPIVYGKSLYVKNNGGFHKLSISPEFLASVKVSAQIFYGNVLRHIAVAAYDITGISLNLIH